MLGNTVAVVLIPFVGNLSDRIGRRIPIMVGALGSGLLSYGYLYAISIHNVPLAIVASIMMWGVVYQGYNAIFPSFYPEMFPARTRVSAVAIAQNIGTMLTALMPAVFAIVAPPGSNVPMIVGSLTFGVTIIAAVAAFTARETYRLRLEDLGNKNASPIPEAEYERIRLEAPGGAPVTVPRKSMTEANRSTNAGAIDATELLDRGRWTALSEIVDLRDGTDHCARRCRQSAAPECRADADPGMGTAAT